MSADAAEKKRKEETWLLLVLLLWGLFPLALGLALVSIVTVAPPEALDPRATVTVEPPLAPNASPTITITNRGTRPLVVHRVTVDPGFDVRAESCGHRLAPRHRCAITVSRRDPHARARTHVRIETDAPGRPIDVPITVPSAPETTAVVEPRVEPRVGAALMANPASVRFRTVLVGGTSESREVVISNIGAARATGLAVSLQGSFRIDRNGCRGELPPRARCTVAVTFHPTAVGSQTGELIVASESASAPASVHLIGLATRRAEPRRQAPPPPITEPEQPETPTEPPPPRVEEPRQTEPPSVVEPPAPPVENHEEPENGGRETEPTVPPTPTVPIRPPEPIAPNVEPREPGLEPPTPPEVDGRHETSPPEIHVPPIVPREPPPPNVRPPVIVPGHTIPPFERHPIGPSLPLPHRPSTGRHGRSTPTPGPSLGPFRTH